jgi:hypothetical protein
VTGIPGGVRLIEDEPKLNLGQRHAAFRGERAAVCRSAAAKREGPECVGVRHRRSLRFLTSLSVTVRMTCGFGLLEASFGEFYNTVIYYG